MRFQMPNPVFTATAAWAFPDLGYRHRRRCPERAGHERGESQQTYLPAQQFGFHYQTSEITSIDLLTQDFSFDSLFADKGIKWMKSDSHRRSPDVSDLNRSVRFFSRDD